MDIHIQFFKNLNTTKSKFEAGLKSLDPANQYTNCTQFDGIENINLSDKVNGNYIGMKYYNNNIGIVTYFGSIMLKSLDCEKFVTRENWGKLTNHLSAEIKQISPNNHNIYLYLGHGNIQDNKKIEKAFANLDICQSKLAEYSNVQPNIELNQIISCHSNPEKCQIDIEKPFTYRKISCSTSKELQNQKNKHIKSEALHNHTKINTHNISSREKYIDRSTNCPSLSDIDKIIKSNCDNLTSSLESLSQTVIQLSGQLNQNKCYTTIRELPIGSISDLLKTKYNIKTNELKDICSQDHKNINQINIKSELSDLKKDYIDDKFFIINPIMNYLNNQPKNCNTKTLHIELDEYLELSDRRFNDALTDLEKSCSHLVQLEKKLTKTTKKIDEPESFISKLYNLAHSAYDKTMATMTFANIISIVYEKTQYEKGLNIQFENKAKSTIMLLSAAYLAGKYMLSSHITKFAEIALAGYSFSQSINPFILVDNISKVGALNFAAELLSSIVIGKNADHPTINTASYLSLLVPVTSFFSTFHMYPPTITAEQYVKNFGNSEILTTIRTAAGGIYKFHYWVPHFLNNDKLPFFIASVASNIFIHALDQYSEQSAYQEAEINFQQNITGLNETNFINYEHN